jgi:hypothetical protein
MAKREPKSRSRKRAPTLPGFAPVDSPTQVWLNRDTCIVRDGEWRRIVFHGTQAASWCEGETAIRNALLVQLAQEPRIVLEDLAKAFGLSSEAVRLIRRKAEAEGLLAVMLPTPRDRHATAPELVERMERLFEQGKGVEEVFKALRRKVARSTVSKYHARWAARRPEPAPKEPEQQNLVLPTPTPPSPEVGATAQNESASAEPEQGEIRAPREESEYRPREEAPETAEVERKGAKAQIEERLPRSRRGVQHAGAWLLTAMVGALGLYDSARRLQAEEKESQGPLRVALDAIVAALAIGEGCVEGVRRLATRAGASLLLSSAAPSATWVRRTVGIVARSSERFHEHFVAGLLRAAREAAEPEHPVIFYVDNHTREYTGDEMLTWHWKMQEDCAVRGVTDYWIHDRQGRPISAVTAFQQGSLVQFLPVCAKVIRKALGEETKVLVVFDRGGAFPTAMVDLQALPQGPVDFLTYERAPFRHYGREYFERHGTALALTDRNDEKQRVVVLDGGTYLGKGRGRVRRLCLLLPEDSQINMLTSSAQEPEWLVKALFSRWVQENAFKYGKERWGFDQLDSRQVVAYPPGTIIPNPYRTNLERSRGHAAEQEGKLRCQLARLERRAPERVETKKQLAEVTEMASLIKTALHRTPHHIPIEKTHLAGELVHHQREYKLVIDTLRIAGMNAEDQLAHMLKAHLSTEPEAKRVVQNLLKASGNIQVGKSRITVTLDPSANRAELRAIRALLGQVNRKRLSHPGDPERRRLEFRLQGAARSQGA